MLSSFAFARWLLSKHNILSVDFNDSDWAQFLTTDAAASSKAAVEALIPQLVQKMPAKPRAKPASNKHTRADAQTNTDFDLTLRIDDNYAVAAQEEPVKDKKTKKSKKATQAATQATQEENDGDVENKKKKKKNQDNEDQEEEHGTKDVHIVDVVSPIDYSDDLLSESYDQTILQEVFVNELLFYFDPNQRIWFDSTFNTIADPTI